MKDRDHTAEPDPGDAPAATGRNEIDNLAGAELGLAVAHEVMGWHSDHEQYTDCWVTADGKLTGYYYGRPFSPYRDRNALAEVWKRIDALGLREHYMNCLASLLRAADGAEETPGPWSLHTCNPELACRAAVLAVRSQR